MRSEDETIGRLRAELLDLSDTIRRTMREVATIRHPIMANDRVQSAVDELDAIVAATELATEQILTAAETIESSFDAAGTGDAGAEAGSRAGNRQAAIDAVTSIYEACNFQDITGQRITRVMTLLRDVDARLVAIIEHVGCDRFIAEAAPPEPEPEAGDKALLNGPAAGGSGLQQSSIDSLFA
jgi:chemotaxis protein CheZ